MFIELLLRVGIRPVHVSLEPLSTILGNRFIVLAQANKRTLKPDSLTILGYKLPEPTVMMNPAQIVPQSPNLFASREREHAPTTNHTAEPTQ